jgi:hypothetical protein
MPMTQEYLIGELSARLEQLLTAATSESANEISRLRGEVETSPAGLLPLATERALALADVLCWDSLGRGDSEAFARQAWISADLWLFGVSARLISE